MTQLLTETNKDSTSRCHVMTLPSGGGGGVVVVVDGGGGGGGGWGVPSALPLVVQRPLLVASLSANAKSRIVLLHSKQKMTAKLTYSRLVIGEAVRDTAAVWCVFTHIRGLCAE